MDTKTTRLPVDLLDAAEAEGLEEHRSTSKQVEHWARFGMYFDRQTSATRRRIQRAVAGEIPLGDLGTDERMAANALVDASISTAANGASFADRLAARGVTTVVMDDEGRMVRRHPDGSTTVL
ncbi:MAG: TA system antitoxin ParD family protein [Acidimicrobiales bacterium]